MFAACSPLYQAVWLACLLAPGMFSSSLRAEPVPPPLNSEQQKKIKERDRYAAEVVRLQQEGKLAQAIAAAQKMLAIERQVFGDVHEDVVGSLEWLADLFEQQENFTAARTARQEVLTIRLKLHGEKDWRVTDARWALSDVERLMAMTPAQRHTLAEAGKLNESVLALMRQGRAREAVQPALRAVQLRKEVLGEKHPDHAISLNNLAGLYDAMGEYAKAEPLYRQALEIRKQTLGVKHPRYATTLNNLAESLESDGKYAQAEPLLRQALEIRKQTLGAKHPAYADSLNNLALLYQSRGDYARAAPLLRGALQIRKETLGEKDPAYGQSLDSLATLYYRTGDYARAEPLLRQALRVRRQALGAKHPVYAYSLNNLATLYMDLGDNSRAEPLFREALAIRKEALGEKHPDYAASLNNLATLYNSMGDYSRAEPLFREALEVRRQVLGEKHPDYALTLNNLAQLYMEMGNYVRAEPLLRQALQIYKQTRGEKHPDYASSVDNLAQLYEAKGDYVQAETLFRQALAIRKEALGERHPEYTISLNNLAGLYQSMGQYAEAEHLCRQALKITRAALGEQHPSYAASLNNLAALYKVMGDDAQAEPLFRQALQILKQMRGELHPSYAAALRNLAALYQDMGDYAQAELLYGQALHTYKQVLRQKHPEYATTLDWLAQLYEAMGEYARAEPLLQQALAIRKEVLGEKHPAYATSLNNLGWWYKSVGKYKKAEPLYRQALTIRKQTLGEKHPLYAASLNNLAVLYRSLGDYTQAEPLYRQALQITRDALGKHHMDYATGVDNLAWLYWSQAAALQLLLPPAVPLHHLASLCGSASNSVLANDYQRRAINLSWDNLELTAAAQSERQQLTMLAQLRYRLDGYLSRTPQGTQEAAQYRAVLAWKGAVGRRQRLQRLAHRRPDLAPLFADLERVSTRLAALSLATPDPRSLQQRRELIEHLTEEKEHVEATLAGKSAAFRIGKELQHLEPAQLQAALPADAALLDFLEYDHYSPALWKEDGWQRERRLVAFVVRRDRLARVDLGPTEVIGAAVQHWRLALQRRFRTEGDARLGCEVSRLIWQPLQQHLQGASVVLVSPDGALDRIPFAALPGSRKDSYLLEEVALAVVPIPQLLPQLPASGPDACNAGPSLLLVGDVTYDSAAGATTAPTQSRAAPRRGKDALFHWQALANTAVEVAAIGNTFRSHHGRAVVTTLQQGQATEAAVRQQAPSHRYLHFATHGYFAPTELRSALAELSHGARAEGGDLFQRHNVAGFHPGLLSGLVLAGANRPVDAEKDDGILTALEVEALDFSRVELATLSACETGLGESAGGEGLLGLQRAFQIAGARSVVAGLWQVDDAATRKLMIQFYTNLWEKKLPKLEALRQAQLWMLREGESWMQKEGLSRGMVDVRVPKERLPVEDGRLAPYYWAAFSLSGDWR